VVRFKVPMTALHYHGGYQESALCEKTSAVLLSPRK
jgi:hypothetical protein